MNSIVYLLRKSIKNNLLELKKKPGKLVMYLFLIALIVMTAVMSMFTKQTTESYVPLFWLKALFFAYTSLFLVISIKQGLSTGSSFFEMSDVNLLFVSPVNPRKILLYGIIKLAKVSFFAGFFILFQSSTLSMNFGIGFSGVLLIFFVLMLSVISLTVMSLLIYTVVNGDITRKLIVKIASAAVFAPAVFLFVKELLNGHDLSEVTGAVIVSPFLTWIPIAGWSAESVTALLSGNTTQGWAFLGLAVISTVIMVLYIVFSRSDYYEDVLCATETAFEKTRAVKEGNVNVSVSSRKIKVVKTGIGGSRSSSVFRKHLRESFRENRLGFLGITSLILFVVAIVTAILMPEGSNCVMILQILMWMQIFFIGAGRGLKELYMHYIYLIPESSFSKIIWSNIEIMLKTLIESVIIFVVAGIILKDSPLIIVGAIITYALFSLVLLGVNYLSMRYVGADISMGLLLMIYVLAVIIIMLPGIVAALIIGYLISGNIGAFLGLLIVSVWEALAGLVCFGLSKGILHNCDMPVAKSGK